MILSDSAIRIIKGYSSLGERRLGNGAQLIGHIPHRGPAAYLHTLFPAALRDWIEETSGKVSATEAFGQYAVFLAEHNGANFFLGSLALNGIRRGLISRSSEDRQPFDLVELNSFERPKNADPKCLFVGSYNWDGSLVGVEPDGNVLVCKKLDATPYARWPNLGAMVSTEVVRLAEFFDRDGRIIDKAAPRVPVPNI
jgi:hypothetical protein